MAYKHPKSRHFPLRTHARPARILLKLKKSAGTLANRAGQGVVESLFVTLLFLSAVVFAMVQLNMIGLQWLRANEAALGVARCAAVNDGNITGIKIEEAAKRSALYTMGAKAVLWPPGIDQRVSVWYPGEGVLGEDKIGADIKMLSGHIYYHQPIAFASLLQPLLGDNDVFTKTKGMAGSFYGGGFETLDVVRKDKGKGISGAVHARLVKSTGRTFLNKAWPSAKKFDE